MRKIALFCILPVIYSVLSYAQDLPVAVSSPEHQQQATAVNMPVITVTRLPEGQYQVSILITKEDKTTQEYLVKVDRHDNQERLIRTTDASGRSMVSVLGQSGQVKVQKLSDVAISEDGILVDAADLSAVTPTNE
jgi:hypothetical protein